MLGAKMSKMITDSLNIKDLLVYYWVDSTIVLGWLRDVKNNRRWKQFVSNRVNQIRNLANTGNYRYVSSGDNVADLATRGVEMKNLIDCQLWWKGPEWLRKNHDRDWPLEPLIDGDIFADVKDEILKLVRPKPVLSARVLNWRKMIDMTKYSQIYRLFRVVARCIRFISNCKLKKESRNFNKVIVVEEMHTAEMACIKMVQKEVFSEQISALKNKSKNNHLEYKNLRIFLFDGILFVKSRLSFNPDKSDKLILLPTDHHYTRILIWSYHKDRHHAGCRDLIAFIREHFWIVRIRQTINSVLKTCAICKRWSVKNYNTEVAPLPVERITISRVFSVCGLDFLGHCFVYDGNEATKAYILLFTCATTRAIHLELVSNMSVYAFLLAFKRFVGRRGVPAVLVSDNFSSFKRANQDLIEAWKNIESTEFNDYLTYKRIEWKFIVECAPFWGGFYERMVRSVKIPLRKILRVAKVNSEELNTIIKEIESL